MASAHWMCNEAHRCNGFCLIATSRVTTRGMLKASVTVAKAQVPGTLIKIHVHHFRLF
jgi:hypothetical protein